MLYLSFGCYRYCLPMVWSFKVFPTSKSRRGFSQKHNKSDHFWLDTLSYFHHPFGNLGNSIRIYVYYQLLQKSGHLGSSCTYGLYFHAPFLLSRNFIHSKCIHFHLIGSIYREKLNHHWSPMGVVSIRNLQK